MKTDSKGEFLFTLPSAGLTLTITKSEYMSKDVTKDSKHKIISGSTNDLGSLPLYPNDGVFKIVLFNKNGLYNSIYGVIQSNIMRMETIGSLFFSDKTITTIPEGQEIEKIYNLPSDDWVKVYWGSTYFSSTQFAPHIDSFYVNRTDTSVFKINF